MNAPRLTRSEALALQALVQWADERSAASPFEYLRGYLAHAALEAAPDPRKEPAELNGSQPLGRVLLERRPR
jgi:hypothetical protein